jgi:glycosyltransferase involved in cell wall biosynthesis
MTRGLAIIDTVCPRPYSLASLSSGGLGGTEATVVRIAEALDAQVFQRGRSESEGRYRPLEELADPAAMIVLRDPKAAAEFAERFVGVPLFIWMHDLIISGKDRATRLRSYGKVLADAKATIVAVSDFHKEQIESVLAPAANDEAAVVAVPRVVRVYNPIAEGLVPGPIEAVDPDQLIYFSSPTKGLDFAIFVFRALRRRWPKLRLMVANPGYLSVAASGVDGVIDLGALPQKEVLAHVSGSLGALCPNFEFPETFGLVLAESNAVGTPVLAHPIGAAAEVLNDPRQIIEVPKLASLAYRASARFGSGHAAAARAVGLLGGFQTFEERIDAWRAGARPVVRARPEFSLAEVIAGWRSVLPASS